MATRRVCQGGGSPPARQPQKGAMRRSGQDLVHYLENEKVDLEALIQGIQSIYQRKTSGILALFPEDLQHKLPGTPPSTFFQAHFLLVTVTFTAISYYHRHHQQLTHLYPISCPGYAPPARRGALQRFCHGCRPATPGADQQGARNASTVECLNSATGLHRDLRIYSSKRRRVARCPAIEEFTTTRHQLGP